MTLYLVPSVYVILFCLFVYDYRYFTFFVTVLFFILVLHFMLSMCMFVIMSELLSNANSQVANCSNIVKFNNHQNLYTYIVRCQDKT